MNPQGDGETAVVPRLPTEAMLEAAHRATPATYLLDADPFNIWSAMLAAASSTDSGEAGLRDGWIEWSGQDNPVPGLMIDVISKQGRIFLNELSADWRWRCDDLGLRLGEVSYYRLAAHQAGEKVSAPSQGGH